MGIPAGWIINLSRQMKPEFINSIFEIKNEPEFRAVTLDIFKYQREKNQVYKDFIDYLGINADTVSQVENIPFLPVGFFKKHKVVTGIKREDIVFESSGTGSKTTSRHHVADVRIYEESFLRSFTLFYGDPSEYFFTALLPSYAERKNSSLIYMVNRLIERSACISSGFYSCNADELLPEIVSARDKGFKIILLGVSFALLDLAEKYSPDLSGIIVMETGGMKGRRREITREELHEFLKHRFNVINIHSEYGMTELMSQAYSAKGGKFFCPPWMKILIRDPQDPLSIIKEYGRTGGLNIIDLANIHSCSFIATDDLGKLYPDGSFEVLGRLDSSDIRGCNLLLE